MLMLRLQRVGKTKDASYRLVVSDKCKDTRSPSLEILGNYNPAASPKVIVLKKDRIEYWLSKGAQPSATVNNLLINQGITKGKKQKVVRISKARKAKMDEKKVKEQPQAEEKKAEQAVT